MVQKAFSFLSPVKTTWPLLVIALTLSFLGVLTMHPFDGGSSLAPRQLIWIALGTLVYIVCAAIDMRFIRRTPIIISGYLVSFILLALLLLVGHTTMGAKGWFNFGLFSFQPADFAKLVCIALLAKYFSRRHMEIGHIGHVLVSGL